MPGSTEPAKLAVNGGAKVYVLKNVPAIKFSAPVHLKKKFFCQNDISRRQQASVAKFEDFFKKCLTFPV